MGSSSKPYSKSASALWKENKRYHRSQVSSVSGTLQRGQSVIAGAVPVTGDPKHMTVVMLLGPSQRPQTLWWDLSWSAAPPLPPWAPTWKVCWGCWGPKHRSEQACGCHREAESVNPLCPHQAPSPPPQPCSPAHPQSLLHTPSKISPQDPLNLCPLCAPVSPIIPMPPPAPPHATHRHAGVSGSHTWECGSQSHTWGSGTHTWGCVHRSMSSHPGAANPCRDTASRT